MSNRYFIGLMSGTSMDGVDGVLCECSTGHFKVIAHASNEYPVAVRSLLNDYARGAALSAKQHGELQTATADVFAQVASTLSTKKTVCAIGSHGQTVWHQPEHDLAFSLQLDNPARIAAITKTAVVTDFRNQDIANGGQGAPLVPPFHQFLFAGNTTKIILNLGGIANITVLHPSNAISNDSIQGYDIGPANCLADLWCKQHTGQSFDKNGSWGATGNVDHELLSAMLEEPFFNELAPKSTGLETFNAQWLESYLELRQVSRPQDIQATLYQLTAELVKKECQGHSAKEVIVCGGGTQNTALMQAIRNTCKVKVDTSNSYGIHPQHVEAAAFAWLAMLRIDGIPCRLETVTGTKKATCLGGLYLP